MKAIYNYLDLQAVLERLIKDHAVALSKISGLYENGMLTIGEYVSQTNCHVALYNATLADIKSELNKEGTKLNVPMDSYQAIYEFILEVIETPTGHYNTRQLIFHEQNRDVI